MSRLKSMSPGAVDAAGSPGRATARHQAKKQIPNRSSGMILRGHPRSDAIMTVADGRQPS